MLNAIKFLNIPYKVDNRAPITKDKKRRGNEIIFPIMTSALSSIAAYFYYNCAKVILNFIFFMHLALKPRYFGKTMHKTVLKCNGNISPVATHDVRGGQVGTEV